jgi:hypothetical protein
MSQSEADRDTASTAPSEPSTRDALVVGGLWGTLTVAFEFVGGHAGTDTRGAAGAPKYTRRDA